MASCVLLCEQETQLFYFQSKSVTRPSEFRTAFCVWKEFYGSLKTSCFTAPTC
nr:MAG TPA: hypothetical protein [Caudoviricetes sp.]DAR41269.1 MAG TPA: hypothetical protein [Caudoviricetes sp.]